MLKKETLYYLLPPFLLFLLASFHIQTHIYPSGDIGYLLEMSSRLLAGGTYGKDILETNPPLILYLYAPAVLFARLFSIKLMASFQCYIYVLSIYSLFFSTYLLKKLNRPLNPINIYPLFWILCFILLLLPLNQFGQREHLLLIFILPWLFAATLKLENAPLPASYALLIGLGAGLAFALKPFFIISFVLIELYFIYAKRSFWGFLRIESALIICVNLLYLFFLFRVHPTYVNKLLPLILNYYFPGRAEAWERLFIYNGVYFCWIILICAFLQIRNASQELLIVLTLALLGLILAFVIPLSPWNLHVLPAAGLAYLLMVYLLMTVFLPLEKSQFKLSSLLFSLCLSFLVYEVAFQIPALRLGHLIREHKQSNMQQLIHYLAAQPGPHSLYCFSMTKTDDCYPLATFTDSRYGGRYPYFWWLIGLIQKEAQPGLSENAKQRLRLEKAYFLGTIEEDLRRYQPRWIIINTQDPENKLGSSFEILNYLSQAKSFQRAWKPYRWIKRIGSYQIYEYPDLA